MTTTIEAIYQDGTFKPVESVPIAEGTRVQLVVTSADVQVMRGGIADALAEIAAMPIEGANDGFSGKDHDDVLYPKAPR